MTRLLDASCRVAITALLHDRGSFAVWESQPWRSRALVRTSESGWNEPWSVSPAVG
jgi:hypothetical protein